MIRNAKGEILCLRREVVGEEEVILKEQIEVRWASARRCAAPASVDPWPLAISMTEERIVNGMQLVRDNYI